MLLYKIVPFHLISKLPLISICQDGNLFQRQDTIAIWKIVTNCAFPYMLTTAMTTAVWILVAVFCSLYLYLKANTEIQHGPKYKVHVVAKCKLWMLSSWLCYHIRLPDLQLPSKALSYFNAKVFSMVKNRI